MADQAAWNTLAQAMQQRGVPAYFWQAIVMAEGGPNAGVVTDTNGYKSVGPFQYNLAPNALGGSYAARQGWTPEQATAFFSDVGRSANVIADDLARGWNQSGGNVSQAAQASGHPGFVNNPNDTRLLRIQTYAEEFKANTTRFFDQLGGSGITGGIPDIHGPDIQGAIGTQVAAGLTQAIGETLNKTLAGLGTAWDESWPSLLLLGVGTTIIIIALIGIAVQTADAAANTGTGKAVIDLGGKVAKAAAV